MFLQYFLIGVGGGLGAVFRVILSKLLPNEIYGIPFQILVVNILGCFIMGLLTELMAFYWSPSENMRFFLTTGFLGGFTTFSSFALQFGLLYEKQQYLSATIYATLSVFVSILCFFAGIKLVKLF